MASTFDQVPISNESYLEKLREAIDDGLQSITSQSDEDSIDWKAELQEVLDKIYQICAEQWDLLQFIFLITAGAITIPLLLQIAGFSLLGPVAGSFAAWWQSTIGDITTVNFFAFLQSIGMLPATAAVTGALIEFGVFVWVELKKNVSGSPGDGAPPEHRNSGGLGRRALNPLRPLYFGYRVVRYGFTSKTRFRG
ncbi:hypothetical protein TWF281_001805 [Arthrobotrys megalospora]